MSGRGPDLPDVIFGRASKFVAGLDGVRGQRLAGAVAVVLANAALLGMLAVGNADRPAPVTRPHTALYIVPPPMKPEPEPDIPQTAARPRAPVVPVAPPRIRTPEEEEASTAITAPPAGVPRGLASLLGRDPCDDPRERLRRPDCPPSFGAGSGDTRAKSLEDMQVAALEKTFGPQCTHKFGCLPMPTKTLNGLNPIAPNTPMSAGASGLGGLNDTVGRLAPPNWYHVDPGFGD